MSNAATEILKQLGGNRFLAMTGAKNLMHDNQGRTLIFSITGTKNRANKVRITLTPSDDYTVEFSRFIPSKLQVVPVKTIDGVYNDNLRDIFTAETGLFCTL